MAGFGVTLPGRETRAGQRVPGPFPSFPTCPGGRSTQSMLRELLSQWYLPLPSRPCSAVWPWPRTQGPAPACCRRRRRKVGWFWTKQEIGRAHWGQGFWPQRLSAQPVSKPYNFRNPSQWLPATPSPPSANPLLCILRGPCCTLPYSQ